VPVRVRPRANLKVLGSNPSPATNLL